MSKNYDYDYIVIGSGPAGRAVATDLKEAGKSVAIVEEADFGGAEINTRDLPYKLSLDFARTYHDFVTTVSGGSCHFNLPTLIANREATIDARRRAIVDNLENLGIKLISGFAHFLDNHTISVDDVSLTAANFILATGATLKPTEISGLESVKYYTPDTALDLRRLPSYVAIIGGGPTGAMLAEYFAMLGSGVIIMERGDQLLPREDQEISTALTSYFTDNLGISIITNARVVAVSEDYSSKIVIFTTGTGEKMVRVDTIVLATGSSAFLDYGLENAGVDYKKSGVTTDKYFNTSMKNIFAIGDSLGREDSSTELATTEGHTLASNLLHRQKSTVKYSNIPRIIGTYPGIAVLGMNERDLLSRDLKSHRNLTPLEYDEGFVKILTDHSGRLLGASVVAPNASSALQIKKLLTK